MRLLFPITFLVAACGGSELGGEIACSPGQMIHVGCSPNIGRDCSGRPIMTLCDGVISVDECTPDTPSPPLIVVRRPPGCPDATVTCPASGAIVVDISQGGSGPYTCTWDHQVIP